MRRSEGQDLILVPGETDPTESAGLRLNLAIDGNLTGFVDNALGNGAELVNDGPGEATLRDPYGHTWTFFARGTAAARNVA
jgi:uncharacterized glyoxalase superfamily protein PhnB